MLRYRLTVLAAGVALLCGGVAIAAMRWDRAIMDELYLRPAWLLEPARIGTLYGSWAVLAPAAILGILYGYYQLRGDLAVRLGLGTAAIGLTVQLLKWVLARTRPDVLHQTTSFGGSFPSGHAADSVVVWVMLALMIQAVATRGRKWAKILFFLPLIIGWTRVYLGVHWPSDVIGGWGLGLMVLAIAAGQEGTGETKPQVEAQG